MQRLKSRFAIFVLLAGLLVAGIACNGPSNGTGGSLDVSASPSSVTVQAGASETVDIEVASAAGIAEPVELSVRGLPAGASASFDPGTISGGEGTSTLTISADPSSTAGSATATIEAVAGAADGSTTVSVTIETGSESANLQPDETFTSEDGVVLGALDGTLEAGVEVTVAAVPTPDVPLPDRVQLQGDFFRLSATNDTYSAENPFLIALPVPDGADTSSLALAFLLQPEDVTDGDLQEPTWEFIEGVYDPENDFFVATLPFIAGDGRIVALVTSDAFDSPSFGSDPGTETQQTITGFAVSCNRFDDDDFNNRDIDCTNADEADLEAALETARSDFTGEGFGEPYLRRQIDPTRPFNVFDPDLWFLEYVAELRPFRDVDDDESRWPCGSRGGIVNLGGYSSGSQSFFVCIGDGGVTDPRIDTGRHEYFHATQYGYASVRNGSRATWVIEGTASASENSLGTMARDTSRPLHEVDVALTAGGNDDDPDLIEYAAQDFWVFLGSDLGEGLGYLTDVFSEGAGTSDLDTALENAFTEYAGPGFSGLPRAYWQWAKNQAFEAEVSFDGALGDTCSFASGTASIDDSTITYTPDEAIPATENFSLDPLTSKVVRFEMPSFSAGDYSVVAEIDATSTDVKIKFYDADDAGTTDCFTTGGTSELGTQLAQVSAGSSKTYYALVSNTSMSSTHGFDALLSAVDPQLTINAPEQNASYREGEAVDFRATLTGFTDPSGLLIEWTYEVEEEDPVLIVESANGETVSSTPTCDDLLVRAEVTDPANGETANDTVAIHCIPKQESFFYNGDRELGGYVYSDGTVVAADLLDYILAGDDSDNNGVQGMVHFDVNTLPDDLASIESAELTVWIDDVVNDPFTDLLDLAAVHVDYGNSLDADDYRTKSGITFLPGRSILDVSTGSQTVDVTEAVRYAWDNRDTLGEKVQFAIYFSQETDNDNEEEFVEIAYEDRPGTLRLPALEITFQNF